MNGLQFTDEAAELLERAYLTKDVIAQRLETIRRLNLSSGESILDIGCGPGFLCESMAEIVGPRGGVVGIDISTDLIALCNRRKGSTWIAYEIGDATKLNQSDASFDAVVCTQVADYVLNVDRVVSEAFRVLKPNGRTVFVATDWDTVVWYSENPKRMAAVMKSWEAHCAHPRLPRVLASKLINAGFRFDGAVVFPILNLQYDDDSYSKGLAQLIRDFAEAARHLSPLAAGEETNVARFARERDEALDQLAATSEVLKVISCSPGELEPVFQAILANATRICEATFGNLLLYEGGKFRRVALHNAPQAWAADWQRDPHRHRSSSPILYRLADTKQLVHVAQVIWAIGGSMIALAALVHFPRWAIAAVAVVMIAGHNLFDGIRANR